MHSDDEQQILKDPVLFLKLRRLFGWTGLQSKAFYHYSWCKEHQKTKWIQWFMVDISIIISSLWIYDMSIVYILVYKPTNITFLWPQPVLVTNLTSTNSSYFLKFQLAGIVATFSQPKQRMMGSIAATIHSEDMKTFRCHQMWLGSWTLTGW